MNTQDLAPIRQQVERNLAAERSWCLTHPAQMKDLLVQLEELSSRLDHIHQHAQKGLVALADHHLHAPHDPNAHDILWAIEVLSDVS